jgi:hypothetical protein
MGNGSHTTHTVTTSDKGDIANLKLDKGLNLARFKIHADSVIDSDEGVGVAKSATVMGNHERDSLGTNLELLHLAQLVLGLLIRDAVHNKASLGVVENAKVFSSLLNLNNVHEASGVVGVSANLTVNLDEALHDNASNLTLGQGILQAVADEHNERETLTELVGSRGGTRGKGAGQFVQHPRLGGRQTL